MTRDAKKPSSQYLRPERVKDAEIEIMTANGVVLTVSASYISQWSKGLRRKLWSKHRGRRVSVAYRSETVRQFLDLVASGNPCFEAVKDYAYHEQVMDLARFLQHYECSRALRVYLRYMQGRQGFGQGFRQIPPLCVFLVGAVLRRPKLCKLALDRQPESWAWYDAWMRPPGVDKNTDMLHPAVFPPLSRPLPEDYLQALCNAAYNPCELGRSRGDMFLLYLHGWEPQQLAASYYAPSAAYPAYPQYASHWTPQPYQSQSSSTWSHGKDWNQYDQQWTQYGSRPHAASTAWSGNTLPSSYHQSSTNSAHSLPSGGVSHSGEPSASAQGSGKDPRPQTGKERAVRDAEHIAREALQFTATLFLNAHSVLAGAK